MVSTIYKQIKSNLREPFALADALGQRAIARRFHGRLVVSARDEMLGGFALSPTNASSLLGWDYEPTCSSI